MINEPGVETLKALARLEYSDDFKTMKAWLESELTNISQANDEQMNETIMRRGQGAAMLLRRLLSIQSNAEFTLNKLASNTKARR